jgi:tight adherence protein C
MLVLLFVAVAAAVWMIAEAATAARRQRRVTLSRVREYGGTANAVVGAPAVSHGLLGGRVGRSIARLGIVLTPGRSYQAVTSRLFAAGIGLRVPATSFVARKVILGLAGVAFGAFLGSLKSAAAAFLLAFIYPEMAVGRRGRARLARIQRDMPNALDVLAIAVEAGAGFDAAVTLMTSHLEGPLADEFRFMLNELRIGETRTEALRKLAERADVPEMRAFTSAIIQGERLGTPLSRILRSLAADTRRRRQFDAEEHANKMAVKMIFPLVFFIMPAMFIVILGPAVINLVDTLG